MAEFGSNRPSPTLAKLVRGGKRVDPRRSRRIAGELRNSAGAATSETLAESPDTFSRWRRPEAEPSSIQPPTRLAPSSPYQSRPMQRPEAQTARRNTTLPSQPSSAGASRTCRRVGRSQRAKAAEAAGEVAHATPAVEQADATDKGREECPLPPSSEGAVVEGGLCS